MNKKQILDLFKVNLLYANPQTTLQLRKKHKSTNKLTRSILSQYVWLALLFAFMYGVIMFTIDYPRYPGYFTLYCAMFVVMSFSQSISVLYNVFYDSKDLQDYLPLPFQQSSVFLAKFLTVGLTVIPFQLPLLVLFVLTGYRSDLPIVGIILAFVLFFVFFGIVLGLSVLIVSLLVQSKGFNRHKSLFTTLLMLIPNVVMIAGILYLNTRGSSYVDEGMMLQDQTIIYPFYPLHQVIAQPFSLSGIISFVILAVIVTLLILVTKNVVIPKMYAYASGDVVTSDVKVNHKKLVYMPLDRQLMRYNLSLIKNPTLLLQSFSTIFLMPFVMMFNLLIIDLDFGAIPGRFWLLFVLVGFFYATFTVNSTSIVSMIISLDQENFDFVRSLPMSLSDYLKMKFKLALTLQFAMTGILLVVLALILGANPFFILGLLLGDMIGIYISSSYYFYRDYRLLNLNWTSLSQLFTRGAGNFGTAFIFIGVILIGSIITVGIGFLLMFVTEPFIVTLAVLAVLLAGCFFAYRHYNKVFWHSKDLN